LPLGRRLWHTHRLVVRRQGRRLFDRTLDVTPESDTRIDVELINTSQRGSPNR
jgi:hypothetical protein